MSRILAVATVNWALRYAEIGWHVVPQGRDKRPLPPHGARNATIDPDVIRDWWYRWPSANIAVAGMGQIAAIDVDPRKGGLEQLDRLSAKLGTFHSNAVSLTGGGGNHYVFRDPGAAVLTKGTWDRCPGVELKRGYALFTVPPSIHKSGNQYRWLAPPVKALKDIPESWLSAIRREEEKPSAPVQRAGDEWERAKKYISRADPAIAGQGGHQQTFWLAQVLVRGFALDLDVAFALMLEWNEKCLPPWSAGELRYKLRSALESGGMPFGAKLRERNAA